MIILTSCFSCRSPQPGENDFYSYVNSHKEDLTLSVYITAQAVDQLLSTEPGRREAVSILKANGITKVYVEVYRGGLVVKDSLLKSVTVFFKNNGFDVAGGIATVPGDDFGVRQEAQYGWFNWESKKTQDDLRHVMETTAPFFDSFIVDDFLCTADTSQESKNAKGDRSWPEYRRDLLVRLSKELFIDPAKKTNPEIQMIIKYPQWYDRYHIYGYDVARQPGLFDEVWIGTEVRDPYTRRFGYVQPYESFIDYRWMASLSGEKMGGAWFDHIECSAENFIDQAYQSVLGGAKELILFNYYNFTEGHPGHHLLRMQFGKLADLAHIISQNPVQGPAAYKPPNSDGGGDLYIMDYIGMIGVPLVPVSTYPEGSKNIFLPAQAADDPEIYSKIMRSLNDDAKIVMTSGFLEKARERNQLEDLAGVKLPDRNSRFESNRISVNGRKSVELDSLLNVEAELKTTTAEALLEVFNNNEKIPYLTRNREGDIYVLNAHTFSQQDFEKFDELLLCPRPLTILDLPREWTHTIRDAFVGQDQPEMDAPARVTFQPFGNGQIMLQNYNRVASEIILYSENPSAYRDMFTNKEYIPVGNQIRIKMPAGSKLWLIP